MIVVITCYWRVVLLEFVLVCTVITPVSGVREHNHRDEIFLLVFCGRQEKILFKNNTSAWTQPECRFENFDREYACHSDRRCCTYFIQSGTANLSRRNQMKNKNARAKRSERKFLFLHEFFLSTIYRETSSNSSYKFSIKEKIVRAYPGDTLKSCAHV